MRNLLTITRNEGGVNAFVLLEREKSDSFEIFRAKRRRARRMHQGGCTFTDKPLKVDYPTRTWRASDAAVLRDTATPCQHEFGRKYAISSLSGTILLYFFIDTKTISYHNSPMAVPFAQPRSLDLIKAC